MVTVGKYGLSSVIVVSTANGGHISTHTRKARTSEELFICLLGNYVNTRNVVEEREDWPP